MQVKHFKAAEFACRCGCGLGLEHMDPRLVEILDLVRAELNMPLRINSAVRCSKHNAAVGGSARSEHVPQNTDTGKCTGVDVHLPNTNFLYHLLRALHKHAVPRLGLNQQKMFLHLGLSKNHPQHVFFNY